MPKFTTDLYSALAASSKVLASFDGLLLEADPISLPAEPGRLLRLSAARGDYVLHAGNQPVRVDEDGRTTFVDIEGCKIALELWTERPLRPVDLPNTRRLVFETYQCSRADGTIELGWCFKPGGGDDCLDFDLVVGSFDPATLTQAQADAAWKQSKWAAAAIAAAYVPAGTPLGAPNAAQTQNCGVEAESMSREG